MPCVNLRDAFIFRLPELEFPGCALDIGACCCDLLASWPTHEFIEARLRLANKRFCFGKVASCSRQLTS